MGAQDQLPRDSDDLQKRVATLEKLVATLTASSGTALAQANAALTAQTVSPDVGASGATATWGTSYATFTSFNFTVPTGYTRALIVASGGSALFTNAPSGDDYRMRVLINGTAGGESRALTLGGYISAFSAANLSGLSDGQSLTIALQGRLTTGPGGTAGSAALAGVALYLR